MMMARIRLRIISGLTKKLVLSSVFLVSFLLSPCSDACSQWPLRGSARALGVAGAYGTSSGDVDGLGYNVGSLASISSPRAFGTAEGLRYESGVVGFPVSGFAVGMGVEYEALEDFTYETEEPSLFKGSLYVARELGSRFRIGAGISGVRGTLDDETADGLQLDTGLQAEFLDGLTVGISYAGIGSEVRFGNGDEEYPNLLNPRAVAGLSWDNSYVRVGADALVPDEGSTEMRFGAELTTPWDLSLRSGAIVLEDNEDVVPFSVGLGYGGEDYSIDYAFMNWDDESHHRVSATFALGLSSPKPDTLAVLEPAYRSNISIAESTIRDAVTEIVEEAKIPEGSVVYINETQAGEGAWLVESIFVELLTNAGHATKIGSAPSNQSNTDTTSESSAVVTLMYRIPSMGVEYKRGWRKHLVGTKFVERRAHAKLYARVASAGGEILWAGEAERSYLDVVPARYIPELETNVAGFTATELEGGGWDQIIEPVIVSGIVGGLIYLFYTSKSTD